MNIVDITLNKRRALPISENTIDNDNRRAALSVNAEMMQLGFVMSQGLFNILATHPLGVIATVRDRTLTALQKIVGDDVHYSPMYPNFPKQVMEASDYELFINAIVHYWSGGLLRPHYEKLPRKFRFEHTKFEVVDVIDIPGIQNIFTTILASSDSVTDYDKQVVQYFIRNYKDPIYPDTIPFKENLCFVAGELIRKGKVDHLPRILTNSTDVLRVLTHLSDGDISLAENTRFKSQPRRIRKALTMALHNVIKEEDIHRHKNKWIKAAHCLHVGEYSQRVYDVMAKFRNNEHIRTFYGTMQEHFDNHNHIAASSLLKTRPGEMARRLDVLLRGQNKEKASVILKDFKDVVGDVNTKLLSQVYGHFKGRDFRKNRVVIPKGNDAKAYVIDKPKGKMYSQVNPVLQSVIRTALRERFAELAPLGKCYIDPDLAGCPVPSQMRSASEGKVVVPRGTRLPIGDKGTLRLFIYWKGRDIDLSASFYNEDFTQNESVSFSRMRSSGVGAYHSGDITYAPDGDSEFIDIDLESAANKWRYVAMQVNVFSGPSFADHEICYAGWMTRDYPGSNEIYDPKTVQQKIDVTANARYNVPVLFDLETRQIIWTDMNLRGTRQYQTAMGNAPSIGQLMEAMIGVQNKMSLHELFYLHAVSRGEIVDDPEEADVVFGFEREENSVTPFDYDVIQAEYLV